MIEKGKGKLKVVALAPEIKNSSAAIKYLRENNVIPSIAHTNATAKEAQTGIEAGILGATHTFNAMSGMSHNELGAAGTAVFNPDIYCELIADGYHVNPEFINILFNFKPLDKIILISDNVGAAGTPVGDTELGGVPVINTGDRLLVKSSGHLAGSCLRLCDAVKNVMRFTGLSAEQIIPCLSENPAKYIGVFERKGSITKSKDADLNIFNSEFDLISTVVRGKII